MRSFFHPGSQHRDWCPWVSPGEGEEAPEDAASHTEKEPGKAKPGWEVVLKMLLGIRKCDTVPETEPEVSLGRPKPECCLSRQQKFGMDGLCLG